MNSLISTTSTFPNSNSPDSNSPDSNSPGSTSTAAPAPHRDRFTARLGRPLPPALHAEAEDMSWSTFTSTYAPTAGPIRLGTWESERGTDDLLVCRATIADGDTICALTATASGSIGALTDMLFVLGAGLEIVDIHQYDHSGCVTTILFCDRNGRRAWSMGTGSRGEESSLAALIAAANRLR